MKLMLPRIVGTWCMEFECWPDHHPGCSRRIRQGCEGCEFSIEKTIIEGNEDKVINIGERVQ